MGKKPNNSQCFDTLIKRRDKLRATLESNLQRLQEGCQDPASGNVIDAAIEALGNDTNATLAEENSTELKRVEEALERISRGDYGICKKCGIQIKGERLAALPHAKFCVECQQLLENAENDQASICQSN